MEQQTTCLLSMNCHVSTYLRPRLRESRQISERTKFFTCATHLHGTVKILLQCCLHFTRVRTNFCLCLHWNRSFYQRRVTRLPGGTLQDFLGGDVPRGPGNPQPIPELVRVNSATLYQTKLPKAPPPSPRVAVFQKLLR